MSKHAVAAAARALSLALSLSALAASSGAQADDDRARFYPRATIVAGRPRAPQPVLEHSTVMQPFALDLDVGIGGAKPVYELAVCDRAGSGCVSLGQLTPPWSGRGEVAVRAPAAGAAASFDLVACVAARDFNQVLGCGHVLGEGRARADVSMRFSVFLDSVTVQHTRARTSDTTFYALAGISSEQALPDPSECLRPLNRFLVEVRCLGAVAMGDIQDGTHPLRDVHVGTFEWVPGSNRHVTFGFATVNAGAPCGLAPCIDMRSAALRPLLDKLKAPNAGVLEDFTPELNDAFGWRGCDGPTAAGTRRIFNFRDRSQTEPTVDALTRDTGRHAADSKVFVVPSQAGCGNSSRYKVRWSLRRSSWAASP